MALKVFEGFDHYNSTTDMAARSGWLQYSNANGTFITGPFGTGRAIQFQHTGNSVNQVTMVFADRNASATVGVRMLIGDVSGGGAAMVFTDSVSALANLAVIFDETNFSIVLKRGNASSGTTLYTSANNVWTPSTWNFIEVGVTFSATVGAVEVRINNTTVVNQTGLNTVATGANAQFDVLDFETYSRSSAPLNTVQMDDFYYTDTTAGPGPNPYDGFLGDARCITLFPIGNSSVAFTPFLTSETYNTSNNSTKNYSPDRVFYTAPFTVKHSGQLGATITTSMGAALTGHVNLGLYDGTGPSNGPGNLIAQATPLTNPAAGVVTFTLTSTPDLQSNMNYYWAIISDCPNLSNLLKYGGTAAQWYYQNQPYASGFPSVADTYATLVVDATVGGIPVSSFSLTITNAGNVSEVSMDSDTSYNSSSTLNAEDLLNYQSLPANVNLVIGVQLTGSYRKDDAGTRAVAQALKSGVTEVYGNTNYLPTLTYVYFTDLWELDPNTSTSWSASGVNALAAGYKVAV